MKQKSIDAITKELGVEICNILGLNPDITYSIKIVIKPRKPTEIIVGQYINNIITTEVLAEIKRTGVLPNFSNK